MEQFKIIEKNADDTIKIEYQIPTIINIHLPKDAEWQPLYGQALRDYINNYIDSLIPPDVKIPHTVDPKLYEELGLLATSSNFVITSPSFTIRSPENEAVIKAIVQQVIADLSQTSV